MSKFNCKEFDEVTSAAWKQKIQVDLKGLDYNKTLMWSTSEGVNVKPFYHNDENIQAANVSSNPWKVAQFIEVTTAIEANILALDAYSKGAESLVFELKEEFDLTVLLNNVDTAIVEIQFLLHFLNTKFTQEILNLNLPNCFVNIDPIGHLAKTGNWHTNIKSDFQALSLMVEKFPAKNILSVDTRTYQNSGATITQQLAYAIAHANEYMNSFKDKELPNIQFITSTGGNYFFEIAKIRALKTLYKTIRGAYDGQSDCKILSFPSLRNKTLYDYNVNLLRTTTECMSSVLGGAHTICNLPYDHIYHKSNDFGNRIARNQLLVLKKESAFGAVENASDGSHYIESLTNQLAEKALAIFKQIEVSGGFLKQLKSGTIQRKIKESALQEQEKFDREELVLLGTNKYPNPDDRMEHELQKHPFLLKKARKTLLPPIISKRLSEKSEKKRLITENKNK